MKAFTIFLILASLGCSNTGGGYRDPDMACIWWVGNMCECRYSQTKVYVTENTDTSKMLKYCRGY